MARAVHGTLTRLSAAGWRILAQQIRIPTTLQASSNTNTFILSAFDGYVPNHERGSTEGAGAGRGTHLAGTGGSLAIAGAERNGRRHCIGLL